MGRRIDMLWVRGLIYHGKGVNIPLVEGSIYYRYGGRYAMGRGRYSMGRGVDIPWVGELIYHG